MSTDERAQLLELYKDLRVADVRDGMDWNMMHAYGSMSIDIRPLCRTRAVGIAKTARYLPFVGPVPHKTPEEYTVWQGWYYNNVCTYPWMKELEPGDFIVIDQSSVNVGLCGSNNTLEAFKQGVRGFVTNGGVRDTDEVILQQIPFWSKFCSGTVCPGTRPVRCAQHPCCRWRGNHLPWRRGSRRWRWRYRRSPQDCLQSR